jgi:endonuclease/exonuclease/phosphatase family metal-dependent hydrolase
MRIRVATLNVWALPEPFGRDVRERMDAIGTHLAGLDLDVVAFQEVWSATARNRLTALGQRAGLPLAWHRDLALGGSGLLVLSRLPLLDARFHRFSLAGHPERLDHPDYFGGKGFVRLELETDSGPVSLIDTHLHARYRRDVAHEYRAHRTGQVVQLAMETLATRGPVLVAGDFNFREDHAEYEILTGLSGLRDLAAEADRRQPTIFRGNPYRAGSAKPDRRIDFLFARDGDDRALVPIRVERVFDEILEIGGRPGAFSDHAGVLVEVEIRPHRGAVRTGPRPGAVELAARLLSEGRAAAERRQLGGRTCAGVGLTAASLAALSVRNDRVTRRRLLRGALNTAALVALTPSVGFSILSEVFVPSELRAFDQLTARLSRMGRHPRADRFIA